MSANPDMTIRDIRVTMLRMPWPEDRWLKGHPLGETRDILICEVETAGGVTGMGYLFVFRPGMQSIAACLTNASSRASRARTPPPSRRSGATCGRRR